MHKKGAKLVPNSLIINFVTPVGFKPTTAGAEIIQRLYFAIFKPL
jgi:hypothetical protein